MWALKRLDRGLTWYLSKAMAVMDIVDTKMQSACSMAMVLHRMEQEP